MVEFLINLKEFLTTWHGMFVSCVVVIALCLQITSYVRNRRKMRLLKNVFPNYAKIEEQIQIIEEEYKRRIEIIDNSTEDELKYLLLENEIDADNYYKTEQRKSYLTNSEYPPWENHEIRIFEKVKAQKKLKDLALIRKNNAISELRSFYKNSQNYIFTTIEDSIQDYVKANKGGISDFHLMKDIVDRNCDVQEEDISTQIPVPLYWGLAATMTGILIGVGFLIGDGSLKALLGNGIGNGAKGVEALLGGVALAMIASIAGIILTTIGSYLFKETKKVLERNKHSYLSKIQTELLPTLSTDVSSSLIKMSQNLQKFNSEFSKNTIDFGTVLRTVNAASENVIKTLTLIQNMNVTRIANANVEVYEKLKNCSDEIGTLAEYLNNTNQYLAHVKALNNKLDEYEGRTQILEQAGKFFSKNEKFLAENFDSAKLATQEALKRFNEGLESSLKKLQESLDRQILNFDGVIERQNSSLLSKTKEIDKIVDELKNLSAIKDGISKFENATKEQNRKIDRLAENIEKLAQIKSSSGTVVFSIPKWQKLILIIIGGTVGIAGLIGVIYGISILFDNFFGG